MQQPLYYPEKKDKYPKKEGYVMQIQYIYDEKKKIPASLYPLISGSIYPGKFR
jgi:hypothetical protein